MKYYSVEVAAVNNKNQRIVGTIPHDNVDEDELVNYLSNKFNESNVNWRHQYYFPGDNYYIYVKAENESFLEKLTARGLEVVNYAETARATPW